MGGGRNSGATTMISSTIPPSTNPATSVGLGRRRRARVCGVSMGQLDGGQRMLPLLGTRSWGVEQDPGQLGQDVGDDHQDRDDEGQSLDHREVAGQRGVDEQRADARDREDLLDDQRVADEPAHVEPEDDDALDLVASRTP